jgi:hypothetical protein
MGVDFYVCRACDETFPDCGPYVRCEGCGKPYCGDECADIDGDDQEQTCVDCRGELNTDDNLLALALEKLGMTREQLTAEYKAKSVS